MIKGFLFDLDGLLIDTEEISWHIYKKMLKPYGKTMSMEQYARDYSGRPEVTNLNTLLQKYSLPLSMDEAWDVEKKIEMDLIEEGASLKPGAKEILLYLKDRGFPIALASSSRKVRAQKILTRHGIWDWFDGYALAEDITHPKPNGEVFEKAAASLNLDPSECLVLEDSEAGIQAARNAGAKVICVPDLNPPAKQYSDLCEAVVPDLFEAKKYIDEKFLRN